MELWVIPGILAAQRERWLVIDPKPFVGDPADDELLFLEHYLRELGPVVAALLFASRAGSSITAEIGLMKATEQLTAMDMMAVNPIARVVAPRFWGGVISMPLLAALFSATGVFGGYLIGVVFIGVDEGAFWGFPG